MVTTCPKCGSPRTESQRFCPNCAFDYWEAAQETGQTAASNPPPPPKEGRRFLPLTIGIIVVMAVIGAVVGGGYLNNVGQDVESDVADNLASQAVEPTVEPVESTPALTGGTGVITFGVGLSDDLRVEEEKSTFAIGELGALSASFIEPAGATSIDVIVSSRDAAGAESVVYTETFPISDPAFDVYAFEEFDLSALVESVPGEYVMRYYRETTELAEGTFTISE